MKRIISIKKKADEDTYGNDIHENSNSGLSLEINIDMSNSAFTDNMAMEVSSILEKYIGILSNDDTVPLIATLRDTNGNVVGTARVSGGKIR